jgi:organic radical activating enzyme
VIRPGAVAAKGYLSEVFVSFQGEGAHVGRRHLFVRLAGCNLRCRYCDTPDSLERVPGYAVWTACDRELRSNPIGVEAMRTLLSGILEREQPIDAISFTGGEPLLQADFLADLLSSCHAELGTPILLETNGVLPRQLAQVLPFVDIISMDIKLPSNTGEPPYWDDHEAFLEVGKEKDLYVKLIVDNDTSKDDVSTAVDLIARRAPTVEVYVQPVTRTEGSSGVSPEKLVEVYKLSSKVLKKVRILPQTHKMMGLM